MKKELDKSEYRNNGINTEIILEGKTLSSLCTLDEFTFQDDFNRKILIYGNSIFIQNGQPLERFEMIKEVEEFFLGEIRGANVNFVRFNRKTGELNISVSANSGKIEIKVNESTGYERWQYNWKKGCIVY